MVGSGDQLQEFCRVGDFQEPGYEVQQASTSRQGPAPPDKLKRKGLDLPLISGPRLSPTQVFPQRYRWGWHGRSLSSRPSQNPMSHQEGSEIQSSTEIMGFLAEEDTEMRDEGA